MSRALYGVFFHHCVTHFPQLLKRWCPMHTMCEWMEMLWGPMRRLTLATSDRKMKAATLNLVIRMQLRAIYKRRHDLRQDHAASTSSSDLGDVAKAFTANFGERAEQRVELDHRFLEHPELRGFLFNVAEHLLVGPGKWYHVEKQVIGEEEKHKLVLHVGKNDTNHAAPARQHFRSTSEAEGRAIDMRAYLTNVRR